MSVQAADRAPGPPVWAVQRVATMVEKRTEAAFGLDAKIVAQKTGMSKSLAKRCIIFLAERR